MARIPRELHILIGAGIAILAVGSILAHPLLAADAGKNGHNQQRPTDRVPARAQPLAVIQGHVTAVTDNELTVRTPDIFPPPNPGGMTPQFIIAGKTYQVDTSGAVFESSSGDHIGQQTFAVGDFIVVVGRLSQPHPGPTAHAPINGMFNRALKASVIERIANSQRMQPPIH